MIKGAAWLTLTCVMVTFMLMVSCGPAVNQGEGEKSTILPEAEEEAASQTQEPLPEVKDEITEEAEEEVTGETETVIPQPEEATSTLAPAPESCQLDVANFYAGLGIETEMGGSVCYLGVFASLANYLNPDLDLNDIVAISGAGSRAFIRNDSLTHRGIAGSLCLDIVRVANYLDAPFIFGQGGTDPDFISINCYIDEAAGTVNTTDGDEALDYLKRIIASGHPVFVPLDTYYTYDDLATASDYWKSVRTKELGNIDNMTVTGYDEEYIYLNDPINPTEAATNLPVRINNFRLAWENQRVPNYMLYLSGTVGGMNVAEIIAWNVELGEQGLSAIRNFSANTNDSEIIRTGLKRLTVARLQYAEFLEENGYEEAAALYRESGNLIFALIDKDGSMFLEFENLNTVADKEEQAIGLLKAAK